MKILAIGAHPDDIELGCGGFLIRAARQGHHIYMYTLTHGEASGNPEKRAMEIEQSSKIIGAKAFWIDNFQDTKLSISSELIYRIEFYIEKTQPDLIFTHSISDLHHDHKSVASSTIEAGRFVPSILSYEMPLTKDFKPQMYYDISEVIDEKVKLLKLFWTQQSKVYLKSNAIKGLAAYRALQSRLKDSIDYVESFEVLKMHLTNEFKLQSTPKEQIEKYVSHK
jgi:LmbE family N-acetylglucosaminyl deacetylase